MSTTDRSHSHVRVGVLEPRLRGYRSAPVEALRRVAAEASEATTGFFGRIRRRFRGLGTPPTFSFNASGSVHEFKTPDDFLRTLQARARVSPQAAAALEKEPPERLARHAATTLATRRRLASWLASAYDDPQALTREIARVDLREVTRDCDWRAIFESLKALDASVNDYRRQAAAAFLQYLTDRERLIDWLQKSPGEKRPPANPPASASLAAAPGSPMAAYQRVPIGATVRAYPAEDNVVKLRFGKHRFRLRTGDSPSLEDGNGRSFPLRHGEQLVGRDPGCRVALPPDLNGVSRQHARIEIREAGAVFVVDLSTNGTFLAGRFEEVAPSELMRWRGLA